MRRHTIVSLLTLFALLAATHSGWLVPGAKADGFTSANIDGGYGFSFSGSVGGTPVSAVGQITASDGTLVSLTRTLNVGGIALVKSTFSGIAQVNPDGTGTAVLCGDNVIIPAGAPVYPAKTMEIFDFVLTGKKSNEIEFVGTGLFDFGENDINDCPSPGEAPPMGSSPIPGGVIIGIARRQ